MHEVERPLSEVLVGFHELLAGPTEPDMTQAIPTQAAPGSGAKTPPCQTPPATWSFDLRANLALGRRRVIISLSEHAANRASDYAGGHSRRRKKALLSDKGQEEDDEGGGGGGAAGGGLLPIIVEGAQDWQEEFR